jgi:hypothetical protein
MKKARTIEVEGNKGASFVFIGETEKEGVVRLRVGHDCIITVDCLISVVELAEWLTSASNKEGGD